MAEKEDEKFKAAKALGKGALRGAMIGTVAGAPLGPLAPIGTFLGGAIGGLASYHKALAKKSINELEQYVNSKEFKGGAEEFKKNMQAAKTPQDKTKLMAALIDDYSETQETIPDHIKFMAALLKHQGTQVAQSFKKKEGKEQLKEEMAGE